jgi:hypothetical protein
MQQSQGNANIASYALRIFLLVILQFLLGALIMQHSQYLEGKTLASPQNSQASPAQSMSYYFENSEKETKLQPINAIFPLAAYLGFEPLVKQGGLELCFEDNGTYLALPNGTSARADIHWAVVLNNQTSVVVPQNTAVCLEANGKGQNTYQWTALISPEIAKFWVDNNASLIPSTNAYPRAVIDYGLLQGIVMVPVFFLFVWYPAVGIWRKIKGGMLEQ